MDPYLRYLVFFIIASSVLLFFFLVIIVTMRLLTSREEKEYLRCEKTWEIIFINYMLNHTTLDVISTEFMKQKNFKHFVRFLNPYLEMLDGKDFEAVKDLSREIGLIWHYRLGLNSRSVYRKAEAAKILGILRCRESLPERIRLLNSNNLVLVLAAAQGLAASGDLRTFRPVVKKLLGKTEYTYEGITEILSRYGENICDPLIVMLDDYSTKITKNPDHYLTIKKIDNKFKAAKRSALNIDSRVLVILLIDLLSHYQYRKALPVLSRLLKQADSETTIHILKAFLRIGSLPDHFDPQPYLLHPDWVVRNFAVQAIELKKDQIFLPTLKKLLDDEQWWVRFHSAKVLLSFGEAGRNILKQSTNISDTRSAAIASYILSTERIS